MGMKANPVLSMLTIIVLSRDRHKALLRQFDLWGNTQVTLLILDNSKKPMSNQVLASIPSNIKYLHNPGGFIDQLESIGDLLNTPYAVMCDDDNIMVQESLVRALNLLEERKDLDFVWGGTATFYKLIGYTYLKESYNRVDYDFPAIDSPQERVKLHLGEYEPGAWYAVHRSDFMSRLTSLIASVYQKSSSAYAAEFAAEAASFYCGKGLRIKQLMLLRSLENYPLDLGTLSRNLRFEEWLFRPEYSKQVQFFTQVMLQFVSQDEWSGVPASDNLASLEVFFPGLTGGKVQDKDFIPHEKRKVKAHLTRQPVIGVLWGQGSRIKTRFCWWRATLLTSQLECLKAGFQLKRGRVIVENGLVRPENSNILQGIMSLKF
jgi:glycosyltransferase domain-containing protein